MQKLDLVFVSEGRGVHLSELRGPRAGCSDGCYFCLLEKGQFSALQEETRFANTSLPNGSFPAGG